MQNYWELYRYCPVEVLRNSSTTLRMVLHTQQNYLRITKLLTFIYNTIREDNKEPVGFELNSNMHTYIWQPYLFFLISDHLCITCLADIFPFLYLCQFLELHKDLYLYKILKIVKCYVPATNILHLSAMFFLYIYDPVGIPCLAIIFIVTTIKLLLQFIHILLEGYFLQNRIIFDSVDKLSPVSNMAYSCLKKC